MRGERLEGKTTSPMPWALRVALGGLLALVLAACLPSVTPTPMPSPVVLEVEVSAALMNRKTELYDCARRLNLALVLQEAGMGTSPALRLRWGPDPEWTGYAAVLGADELVIVVHPENPVQALTVEQVRGLFLGTAQAWPEDAGGGEVHPWGYPVGSDIRQGFEAGVLEGPLPEGGFFLAPGPEELRQGVSADTAAIGFLPRSWLDAQVKAVPVTDLDAARLRARLRLPVLSLSDAEPTGPAAAWLGCVQQQAFPTG